MKNALFDELKDLKHNMVEIEKRENEKRISEIRTKKDKILKEEFLNFIKDSGVKQIDK